MQEWKKELCREQPETLQELGKGTYIQRRNITPYERKDGNGEAGFLQKKNILQPWSRKTAIKIC